MAGLHFHPLRVREAWRDTDDALVVGFEVPADLRETFAFEPGQHLTLRAMVAGQEQRRSYSICTAPGDGVLRVGIRRVPGGVFSGWAHEHLRPGQVVGVMPPEGRFGHALAVPAPQGRHVLCVAAGSGITPMMSIARHVLATEPRSRVTLVYGNRRVASTMFREALEDLKNRHLTRLMLHLVFSQEDVDSPAHAGRIDRARIAALCAGLIDTASVAEAFVCGPHAMNDEVEAALQAAGLPGARIHVERFGTAAAAAAAPGPAAQAGAAPAAQTRARVAIGRDGVTRTIAMSADDGSILDAAVRAGLDLPYSCKAGMCATCRARVLEGQVRMDRSFALEPADLAAGFVLTCQAHPVTPLVRVSFDER